MVEGDTSLQENQLRTRGFRRHLEGIGNAKGGGQTEFLANGIDLVNHREWTQEPRSKLETWNLETNIFGGETDFISWFEHWWDSVFLVSLCLAVRRGLQQKLPGILPDMKKVVELRVHCR